MGNANKIDCLIVCFFFFSTALFAQNKKINLVAENEKIADVLLDLAQTYGYEIIFNQSYFQENKISIRLQEQSLQSALNQILADTKVSFKVKGQTIRLSKKKQIYGYIIDQQSGEKLISAAFYDPKSGKGLYTNDYGFFSIELPFETKEVIASYIGYQSQKVKLDYKPNQLISIELKPNVVLNEIVVLKDESLEDQHFSPNGNELMTNEIKTLLATGGESDIFQYLYQKSGVQTGPDGLGGLHVRGGSADQNMILYDGVKVYNPNHTLGLFSIFNSNILKHARFSKANFSPRSAGRTSSVLDLRIKEGSLRKWQGTFGLSTLATQLNIDGPIQKDKTGLLLSFRRTHLDPYLKKITKAQKAKDEELGSSNHYFFDVNAKIHHRFGDKDRLFLSYYKGQDVYSDKSDFLFNDGYLYLNDIRNYRMEWGNQVGSLRWNHLYGNTLFANTTLSYSSFAYDSQSESDYIYDDYEYYDYESQYLVTSFLSNIKEIGLDYDLEYFPSDKHHLTFGAGYHKVVYEPGAVHTKLDEAANDAFDDEIYGSELENIVDNAYESHETHLYANEDWKINQKSRLLAGFRLSVYETTDFSNAKQQRYNLLSGRLAFHYQLTPRLGLMASYDRSNQPVHLLTTVDVGFPNDLWVPSTAKIKPQSADQLNLSLSYVAKQNWKVTLAAYYKKMYNQLRYLYGSQLPGLGEDITEFWEEEVSVGNGNSQGIELEAQCQTSDFKMDFAYTLSKSDRQFPDFNGGKKYPFQFDQRHQVSANLFKSVVKNWWFYANFKISSGMNQTLYKSDVPYVPLETVSSPFLDEISSTNGYQLPLYHRLDLGIMWQLETSKIGHEFLLGIQNVYNRENIYYTYELVDVFDEEENGQIKNRTSLPLLPTLRYQISF